jgi:polyferredoxin
LAKIIEPGKKKAAWKKRRLVQAFSTLGINIYFPSFFQGLIYQGPFKGVCLPVLNCHSCPSAVGACPVGAWQSSLASLRFKLPLAQYQFGLYVLGVIGLAGSLGGRFTCGWLCPFGLIQEILYKVPTRKLRLPRFVSYFKYAVLAVMVVALPLLVVDDLGYGQTWFCKWICPAGTLEAGLPMMALNPDIRRQAGGMFAWKVGLLAVFIAWMIVTMRPFCRVVCPLGAALGLLNKASFFRMTVDPDRCAQCQTCQKSCPVDIKVCETPNSPDCIRCLKCAESCPAGAVGYEFLRSRKPGHLVDRPETGLWCK